MNLKRREQLLPEVLGILREQAHKFHNKYPWITFDEFMSDAYIGFMQACDKWDPEAGTKFSTWCRTKVWTCISTELHKRFSSRLTYVDEIQDEMLPPVAPAAFRNSIHEQTKDLSPEARRLIQRLISTPGPEPRNVTEARALLKDARRELEEDGYDETHQQIIFHEIKETLIDYAG